MLEWKKQTCTKPARGYLLAVSRALEKQRRKLQAPPDTKKTRNKTRSIKNLVRTQFRNMKRYL
jgi:hypothetical protein